MKKNLLLLLFACLFFGQNLSAQCECTDCPNENYVMGEVVASIASTITVGTAGTDDLAANPLVSVDIDIHHDWLGDVSVSLVSPSGLHYSLMGDEGNAVGQCGAPANGAVFTFVPGNFNPLTTGQSYADICNGTDNCIEGDWTLACGAGAENIHNGAVPSPNCDLNDFNVAGHSVSGTWTLYVNCVCNAEFGSFLNNWGLNFQNEDEIECEEGDGGTGGGDGQPIVIETDIFVGETGVACLPSIDDVTDLCPEEDGTSVEFTFEAPCVTYLGVAPGTDTLCLLVTDEDGNTIEVTIIVNVIPMPAPNVWPGDSNHDGVVNTTDLLYLSAGYGATGPARVNASQDWGAEYAYYWEEETQVSHVNYKFLDTDGNGVIDQNDATAIKQNYGLTHSDNSIAFSPFVYGSEAVSVTAESISATQGSVVNIPITLHTVNAFVLTGVAFDVTLDEDVFDLSTVSFTADGEVFTENVSMHILEENILHVAVAEADDFGSPGQGTVGTLTVQIKEGALPSSTALSLQGVAVMNSAEVAFPMAEPTFTEVSVTTSTEETWADAVRVYPQPASNELYIQSGSSDTEEVTLFDTAGKMLLTQKTATNLTVLDISGLDNGVYLLSLQGAEGTAVKKVVVTR